MERPPILTLVDCAGTERKEDSMWHDAERRKEGAEINQSLHALKECMRHWLQVQDGKSTVIPFRESGLTRVLADSFIRQDTLITVVGTVSPSASDTEHTLTTLKTVAAVAGTDGAIREVKSDVKKVVEAPALHTIPPKLWAEDRLRAWLGATVSSKGEPLAAVLPLMPAGVTGEAIMRMTAQHFRQLWRCPTSSRMPSSTSCARRRSPPTPPRATSGAACARPTSASARASSRDEVGQHAVAVCPGDAM